MRPKKKTLKKIYIEYVNVRFTKYAFILLNYTHTQPYLLPILAGGRSVI